ncbi:hypothetical protein LTR85_011288 [Meristemomyces frigidus]|nr:hypothetical protein LTR85_011288 [Meristemomyces frigidus]
MKLSVISLTFAAGGMAAVLKERSSKAFCQSYTDTYDDLSSNPLLPTTEVGTYHGLTYSAFVVDEPLVGTSGIVPTSSPNVAAATMQQDELQLGSLSLNPFGTIATASGTKAFDLRSFYFAYQLSYKGCVVDDKNTAVTVSSGCTIAVTGYYATGQQAPEVTFAFAPTSLTEATLVLAELPATYTLLKNVTFGIADGAVVTAETVLDIDNVVHCNYL